jgi:hypothetical protein
MGLNEPIALSLDTIRKRSVATRRSIVLRVHLNVACGTFETCRRTLKMSANRGRVEVSGVQSGKNLHRREGGTAVTWPLVAHAQKAPVRIGFLTSGTTASAVGAA